jgi:ParB-like chromosome segregation protein Spo0J
VTGRRLGRDRDHLVNPTTLKPHSVSENLYGEINVDSLVDSIKEYGILVSLVIKSNNSITSGCRRWKAAIEIGLPEVPVEVKDYADEWEEKRDILEYNRYRDKTFSQKMKEAELLKEILAEEARRKEIEAGKVTGRGHKKVSLELDKPLRASKEIAK